MDRDSIVIETLKDVRKKLLERVGELEDAYRILQIYEDINLIEKLALLIVIGKSK